MLILRGVGPVTGLGFIGFRGLRCVRGFCWGVFEGFGVLIRVLRALKASRAFVFQGFERVSGLGFGGLGSDKSSTSVSMKHL